MPKIETVRQLLDASQSNNFLNTSAGDTFTTVSAFREKLDQAAEQLDKSEETRDLSRQLKQFAGDIDKLQRGSDTIEITEQELQASLDNVNQNMGEFFRKNYQTILDAGKTLPNPLTQEEMDTGLGMIADTMGIELLPKAPQTGQEAPEAQPEEPEAEPLSYDDAARQPIAMYIMDDMERNGPAAQALDQLLERLNASPQKDLPEVKSVLDYANETKNKSVEYLKHRQEEIREGHPDTSENYHSPSIPAVQLRRQMKALQTKSPQLYEQLCAPYVEIMRRHDYAPEKARHDALYAEHERQYQEDRAKDKADRRELSKPVTLYEDQVEMTENSVAFGVEKLRNDIINSPGFQEDPPVVEGRDLAELFTLINASGEAGPYKAVGQLFWDSIPTGAAAEYAKNQELFDQLAKEPDLIRTLQEREPGKSWFDSKTLQFTDVFTEVDQKYAPNYKRENTARAKETIENACELLNDYGGDLVENGNEDLNPLYAALMKLKTANGKSSANANLQMREKAMGFLDSLSADDVRHTEGAKECVDAALSAMAVTLPPEEVEKGCALINGKMGLSPWDKGYYAAAKYLPLRSTALSYIDNCKRSIKDDISAREQAAKIFAARIAVDTKGGKAAYLKKPLSETQADEIAEALNDSENFKDWLKTLNKDKAKALLSGHGGDLEKDFRRHLLKAPPGKLENDPVLRRYMPTAKERIEELQRQVKDARKARLPEEELNELQAAAAAEIVAIRNACHVERNTGYGLDKPIPPAGEGEKTLAGTVETLCRDRDMKDLLNAKAKENLLDGHGGKMMVDIRTVVNNEQMGESVTEIMNDNTVEQRILKLEDKAGALQEKLQSANKAEREAALKESRQVLGEYIKLSVTDKEKLYDDVPWKSANAAAKSGEKASVIRKITAEPEDAETIMEAVSERNLGALSQFLHDKKKEGTIREADLSPERPQQEERERVSDPYEMDMDRDDDLII